MVRFTSCLAAATLALALTGCPDETKSDSPDAATAVVPSSPTASTVPATLPTPPPPPTAPAPALGDAATDAPLAMDAGTRLAEAGSTRPATHR
jgi:hypothetical protein